jgi:uncharacterized protein YbaP (TraB family)
MENKKFKNSVLKKFTIVATLLTAGIFTSTVSAESSVWKVSKGNDHVYIGGTVHILPANEFPLPEEFTTAYKNTDSIVLETKLPDPTDKNFQMLMMQKMAYQEGKKLSGALSEETYQQLDDYMTTFGVKLSELDGYKPAFISIMMVMMEAQRANISGDGVDKYFNQLAVKDNKQAEYLETMDFQLNMLANMGMEDEDKFIQSNLSQMSEFKAMFDQLLLAWRAGDMKTLTKLVITPLKEDPKTLKALMTDRNKNWIPHIEKMFTDQDKEFILVGVGHLIGEESVLALLKAKGYQVEKI